MPSQAVPTIVVRDRFWRVLPPRWAHRPLSGAGAALRGGRFNEPGMPALYMSRQLMTAVAEYEQDLGTRPGTFCAYDVDTDGIADLTDSKTLAAIEAGPAVLEAPWKRIAFIEKKRPPTWDLVVDLIGRGVIGLLARSVQDISGVNLVLWKWNDSPSRRVAAIDPETELPRNQSSWRD